ncbi:MAG: cytochrome c [Limnohabitans sp.]|nr:cytochrome c [Limnohabitans sp.]
MKNNLLVFKILLIAITGISIIIFLLLYLFQYNSQQNNIECGTKSPDVMLCGTPKLTEEASKGKAIFNSNCAACHKLNAIATGPALRNTDSSTLFKWLTIRNQKINEQKIEQLGIDYHRSMWNKLFTKEDLKNLNAYLTVKCRVP